MTPGLLAEKTLLDVLFGLQREMSQGYYNLTSSAVSSSSQSLARASRRLTRASRPKAAGRPPSAFESRTAFLQLFGAREFVQLDGVSYAAIISGTSDEPFLVREATRGVGDEEKAKTRFLPAGDQRVKKVIDLVVTLYPKTIQVDFAPPFGFQWTCATAFELDISKRRNGSVQFAVNGEAIPAFDASSLLRPCNEPSRKLPMQREIKTLVAAMLYISEKKGEEDHGVDLLKVFMSLDTRVEADEVFEWESIASASPVPASVWRDIFLKIIMRNKSAFSTGMHATAGGQAQHSSYEGTCLRILLLLCKLYPHALQRMRGSSAHAVSFAIRSVATAQYVHMVQTLHHLAFGFPMSTGGPKPQSNSSSRSRRSNSAKDSKSTITTTLWEHQEDAVARVLEGVAEGKKAFADASTVGAGKTLTALAVIDAVKQRFGESVKMYGSLVLLPTNALISEWVQQVFMHTKGVHVLVQNQQGYLKSKGISSGCGRPAVRAPRCYQPKIESDCIVITTLARAREHPFRTTAWDLVVVDECLSVQSPALHSFAAWRQVAASTFGVMMLSATFFRSRLSSLFYMIRMLRSALPRTEPYLATLLHEHIILYVPDNPRRWALRFHAVPLHERILARYKSLIDSASMPTTAMDPRLIYVSLKKFLRANYEASTCIDAMARMVASLKARSKRVLVFATSNQERARLLEKLPNSCSLKQAKHGKLDGAKTLVLTTNEGAMGLNLQMYNAIVTRPQPGDLLEQMKGRIDRPGQESQQLELVVVLAKGTVEEAEAGNIRLCGAFFRQYLDPLSKSFQARAIEASRKVQGRDSPRGKSSGRSPAITAHCHGQVAKAYLSALEVAVDEGEVAGDSQQTEVKRGKKRKKKGEGAVKSEVDAEEAKRELDAFKGSTTERLKRRKVKKQKPRKKLHPHAFLSEGKAQVMSMEVIASSLEHLSQRDRKLSVIISQVGPPTSLLEKIGKIDPFLSLCRSLAFQQLSTKAASTIFARFQELCGGEDKVTPQRVLDLGIDEIRSAGFSRRKAEYSKSLAQHFVEFELTHDKLLMMTDKQVFDSLIQVRGIGAWSIHMFLMFSLGRPDIFPVGDLVVRKACKRIYSLSSGDDVEDTKVATLPTEHELVPIAESWRPYRSIATWLLWHAIESENCTYTY